MSAMSSPLRAAHRSQQGHNMPQTHSPGTDNGAGPAEPPRVSIVIPTYNRGPRLAITIQSVIRQTYPDWELIIRDDGSTDDTREVAAAFEEDPRVHVTTAPNIGVA